MSTKDQDPSRPSVDPRGQSERGVSVEQRRGALDANNALKEVFGHLSGEPEPGADRVMLYVDAVREIGDGVWSEVFGKDTGQYLEETIDTKIDLWEDLIAGIESGRDTGIDKASRLDTYRQALAICRAVQARL